MFHPYRRCTQPIPGCTPSVRPEMWLSVRAVRAGGFPAVEAKESDTRLPIPLFQVERDPVGRITLTPPWYCTACPPPRIGRFHQHRVVLKPSYTPRRRGVYPPFSGTEIASPPATLALQSIKSSHSAPLTGHCLDTAPPLALRSLAIQPVQSPPNHGRHTPGLNMSVHPRTLSSHCLYAGVLISAQCT